MRLMVFGRNGQVATELARLRPDAVYIGRDQADLSQPETCAEAIRQYRPDAVINAAAWTAVDQAESHEAAATTVNGAAPGAMARACADLGAPLVHISTDYVFDGSGQQPWRPQDTPAPLNAYGRSKRAGEAEILASGAVHGILRTSWVFSAHGSNFVKTMLRLGASRDQLNVVADQIGGPTPAADIAASCLIMAEALRQGTRGGIHHYSGQSDTSWACFARETFAMAGMAVTVSDIPSSSYPTPAARPLNSRLDCTQLAADFGITRPDWKAGLALVISEVKGA